MEKLAVVVAAAGLGTRMQAGHNKTLMHLGSEPMLLHAVRVFASRPYVESLVVVVGAGEIKTVEELLAEAKLPVIVVAGGAHRQASVLAGLKALPATTRWVAIHDGARPLLEAELVDRGFAAVQGTDAVGIGVPVKDTIKIVEDGIIVDTPDRSRLWAIQTPQFFAYETILDAHHQAAEEGFLGTDDCSLLERLGKPVSVLAGSYKNLKVTTPEDMILAEALQGPSKSRELPSKENHVMVGFGYDVHRLVTGRPLILCGVEVPHDRGLDGHSDADVAVHALMDALLGAAGQGDIGRHFPDTEESYRGADSMKLLETVLNLLDKHGVQVNNVDITIAAQAPKLASWIPTMQTRLAATLHLPEKRTNIKATTTERLGFVGEQQGIAAYAIVSCQQS